MLYIFPHSVFVGFRFIILQNLFISVYIVILNYFFSFDSVYFLSQKLFSLPK